MTTVVLLGQAATTVTSTSVTLSNVNWIPGDVLYLMYAVGAEGASFSDSNNGTWVSGYNSNLVGNINKIYFPGSGSIFGRAISVRSDFGSNETVRISVTNGTAIGFQLWRVRSSSPSVSPGSLPEVSTTGASYSVSVTFPNVKNNSIVLASSFYRYDQVVSDGDTIRGTWSSPVRTLIGATDWVFSISTQLKTVTAAGNQTYSVFFDISTSSGALIVEIPVPSLPHWGVAT